MQRTIARLVLAAALGSAASVALAEITLYGRENFAGRRFAATQSVSDLANAGFNDRASSAMIRGGSWQLCTDAFFRGRCVTLGDGDYPSLAAMGLNDRISSVRDLGWVGAPPREPREPREPRDRREHAGGQPPRIVLFDRQGASGVSITLDRATPNLEGTGFNDRARSATVHGTNWRLCADADYRGDCEVLRPGRWDDLGGVTGRVSSAQPWPEPVSEHRGAPPTGDWGGRARAILYEGPDLSGRYLVVDREVLANFERTGFNDRASSLRVENGYWLFCSDAQFNGECRTFGPGDYPSLPHELNNRISSGRRISGGYPYSQPPAWSR